MKKFIYDPITTLNAMAAQNINHGRTEYFTDVQAIVKLGELLSPLYDNFHAFGLNPYAQIALADNSTNGRPQFELNLFALHTFPAVEDSFVFVYDDRDVEGYVSHLLTFTKEADKVLEKLRKPRIHYWKKEDYWGIVNHCSKNEAEGFSLTLRVHD